jgi:hypothetical protein
VPEDLSKLLRRRLAEAMIDNARLTRQHPESPERSTEARRQFYQAMYEFALGHITREERRQILELLEPCCPEVFEAARSIAPPSREFPGLTDPQGG